MKTKRTLMQTLRACPTHEAGVSRERLTERWNGLIHEELTDKPSLPVMAALLLHDEQFGDLLDEAEEQQLTDLVQRALDRYHQQTNPPNTFGKLLAGSLQTEI